MIRRKGFPLLVVALVAVLLLTAGSVSQAALQFTSAWITDGTTHTADDQDAEVALTPSGSATGVSRLGMGAPLAVGDFLVGGLNFDQVTPIPPGTNIALDGTVYDYWNAVFAIKVATVVGVGGGNANFTFVAPTLFEWNRVMDELHGGVVGAAPAALIPATAGATAIFYDNPLTPFDQFAPGPGAGGEAAGLANSYVGGAAVAELGMTGALVALPMLGGDPAAGNIGPNGVGEGWQSTNAPLMPPNVASLILVGDPIPGANFNFAVNRIAGFPSLLFIPVPTALFNGSADFVGGGNLEGTMVPGIGQAGPWDVNTSAQVTFRPIPEPASVVIWSLLLLVGASLCLIRLRR